MLLKLGHSLIYQTGIYQFQIGLAVHNPTFNKTNKGFYFSCNKNSTGRHFRAGTETLLCHQSPTLPLSHPLSVFMFIASWPKMAASLLSSHLQSRQEKRNIQRQKCLLTFYLVYLFGLLLQENNSFF